jgi:hypothetical protein
MKRIPYPEELGIEWLESRDALAILEGRNLSDRCQSAIGCAKRSGSYLIRNGKNLWLDYANAAAAKKGYENIMDFLNQPFYANAGGVAIAGVISYKINNAGQNASGCSTAGTANDTLASVISAAVASNPDGQELSIKVTGNETSFTIDISAGPPNSKPSLTCGA